MTPPGKSIELRIRRQRQRDAAAYWETFSIPWRAGLNIVSALMAVRDDPRNQNGHAVAPVAWEYNCMEEVCGACGMMINGRPRQACAALIDDLSQPIVLEPLAKFPVVRDLLVDRGAIFRGLKRVRAWIPIDGPFDTHLAGAPISPRDWETNYLFSRCMSCGCCMAACPQFSDGGDFIGPAPLAQGWLMNRHPTGRWSDRERLHGMMAEGGVSDCGNAQNCARVCPKQIPLTDAIAALGRQVTLRMLRDLLD